MRTPTLWTSIAVAVALSIVSADAHAGHPSLKRIPRLWGTGEIQVSNDGESRVLERFAEPQSIRETAVSPDGKWAYVWHHGRGPKLILSIYELATLRRTARFSPGFGGELHFTPRGNIVHWWGCGTNCVNFSLYYPKGQKLLSGGNSGIDLSPTRRYLMTYPSLFASDEPVAVYDLDRATKVFETDPTFTGNMVVSQAGHWNDARGTVAVAVESWDAMSHRLLVTLGTSVRRSTVALPDGAPHR